MTRELGPNEDPTDRARCEGCQALPGYCECHLIHEAAPVRFDTGEELGPRVPVKVMMDVERAMVNIDRKLEFKLPPMHIEGPVGVGVRFFQGGKAMFEANCGTAFEGCSVIVEPYSPPVDHRIKPCPTINER